MNDELRNRNLESTLNKENDGLLNNMNEKENTNGIVITENELENYKEALSFLKEELKYQKKNKFLKVFLNFVFITGTIGTLFLFFQYLNGRLNGVGPINFVTLSIGNILILMVNNCIYTDNIVEIKKQITDLETKVIPALEQKPKEEKEKTKTLEVNKTEVKVETKKEEVTIRSNCSLSNNHNEQKGKVRSLKLVPKNDNK